MRGKGFDTAQICENGHVINSMAASDPHHNKKFCDECGARTVTACVNCNTNIKGAYHYTGITVLGIGYEPPKFCDNCGEPHIWTKTKIDVAKELAELSEKLSKEEISDLNINIIELVKESPKVPIAKIKVKRYMDKIGDDLSENIHETLSEIIANDIQNTIWTK